MHEFEEVYKEYFDKIFTFLQKLCKNESLAEELTQETFYQAFCSFRKYRGESSLFTWLAAIAKHTYYRYLRKNKLTEDAIDIELVVDTYCQNTLGNPEDEAIRSSVIQAVRKIVRKIPQKQRDVVIMRIYGELPFSEIAAQLGISENSAKVIFFRAKKMLMEEYENEYGM